MAKREYKTPVFTKIKIDKDISLIMLSSGGRFSNPNLPDTRDSINNPFKTTYATPLKSPFKK